MNVFAVPWPTFGVVPGTMCQVFSPASVNAPPSGRTPVGRFASKAVSPAAAPMIAVRAIRSSAALDRVGLLGRGAAVPVTVW